MRIQGLFVSNHREPDRGGAKRTAYDYDSIPVGYYDAVYRRARGVQSKWHHLKFDRFREELAGFGRHLDIGCGPGTFIASLGPEHDSAGVDIAPGQIAYACEHYGAPHRRFRAIEGGRLPFAAGSFDAVTVIELIEHLPAEDNLALLGEALGLLRPGGKLLVSTPNYGGLWPLVEALVNRLGATSYADQHITRYDRTALRDLLVRAGGTEISVGAYMGLAPFAACLGWRLADSIARLEPGALVDAYGLLLFATARRPR